MAQAAGMIALDTNLLIYAHRAGAPEHRAARRAIARASRNPRGWGFALPSVGEFWSVVTHPDCAGGPSSGEQARGFLEALAEAGAAVWRPQPGLWRRLARLAEDLGIGGARVYDLQIALIAFDSGASEIWTHDRGFATLPGLRALDPL